MDFILLSSALILTVFLPGYLIIEAFFADFNFSLKLPLYIILSVLVSTWIVYLGGNLFELNRITTTLFLLAFLPFAALVKINKKEISVFTKENRLVLAASLLTFLLVFIALWFGIFVFHQDYIVLASVNWQDTAMHLGIIESIASGNFPPQAPYMAGKALTYYYFSDLHAAIINILKGEIFPRVLVYVNPFFILSFFLAVYAVSRKYIKSKKYAVAASFLASFYSNWIFIKFFRDLNQPNLPLTLERIKNTIAYGYSIEGELYQMAPMSDYFLQNRPMMVGLPVAVLNLLLINEGFEELSRKKLLTAGLLSALVFKFQLFAFLISVFVFGLYFIVFLRRKTIKKHIINSFWFFAPVALAVVIVLTTNVSGNSLVDLFVDNFSVGGWAWEKGLVWHLKFIVANFGLPLFLFLLSPLLFLLTKKATRQFWAFYLFGLISFLLPFFVNFTIYKHDMFKFFYFSLIPISVLSVASLGLVAKRSKHLALGFIVIVLTTSTFTSGLVLTGSVLNNNRAYMITEYNAGVWMRSNTTSKSVFITLPTVHSPVTQIAGRLRVLSYINWPHSHGFNQGEDNVFTRLENVEKFYSDPGKQNDILAKYKVDYIYYGLEERSQYPETERILDTTYELVYANNEIKIYEVINKK